MDIYGLTNDEIALHLAAALKAWRVSPSGAGMTQADLARKAGIGLTPLRQFEKTGAITLRNLIAILRAMELLDSLTTIVPDADNPSPLDVLMDEEKKARHRRKRAPNAKKDQ